MCSSWLLLPIHSSRSQVCRFITLTTSLPPRSAELDRNSMSRLTCPSSHEEKREKCPSNLFTRCYSRTATVVYGKATSQSWISIVRGFFRPTLQCFAGQDHPVVESLAATGRNDPYYWECLSTPSGLEVIGGADIETLALTRRCHRALHDPGTVR